MFKIKKSFGGIMKYLFTVFVLTFILCAIESNAKQDLKIERVDAKSKFILFVQDTTTTKSEDIGKVFGSAYGEIVEFMQKNNIQFGGMPLAVNIAWDMDKNIFIFKAGIPVAKNDYELSGRIQFGSTYEGKAIKAVHIGTYNESGAVYEAITKYALDNGHDLLNESWEEYKNDPGQVKPEELETHIFIGIK